VQVPNTSAGISVLLLDDSAPLRALLAELLEDLDLVERIVQVQDIESALSAFEYDSFDLAILDLNVRGFAEIRNGIDLARVIKLRSPGTRVALLTALASAVDRNACLAAGADRFYDKGQVDSLLDWIKESAASR
jgi:CheY-like chemotaxis protein